jgi:hypothetical protein
MTGRIAIVVMLLTAVACFLRFAEDRASADSHSEVYPADESVAVATDLFLATPDRKALGSITVEPGFVAVYNDTLEQIEKRPVELLFDGID